MFSDFFMYLTTKYLVNGIHLDYVERHYSKDRIFRNSNAPEYIEFEGVPGKLLGLTFDITEKNLDVMVSPILKRDKFSGESEVELGKREKEYIKEVNKHLEKILTSRFWKDPSISRLREDRSVYRRYLSNIKLEKDDEGQCHIKASIKTPKGGKKQEVVFSVLYSIVRPILLFYREKNM